MKNGFVLIRNAINKLAIDNYLNEINALNLFFNNKNASEFTFNGAVYDIGNTLMNKYHITDLITPHVKNYLKCNEIYPAGWQLRMDQPNNKSELLGWHRDMDYFKSMSFDGRGVVCWLPLRDITLESGGIQIANGKYKSSDYKFSKKTKIYKDRKDHTTYEIGFKPKGDESNIICDAGDLVIFDMTSPHKSVANLSKITRFTLQVRFFPFSDKLVPSRSEIGQ